MRLRVCCVCASSPYGAEGARTPDLLGAIQALSQLSYSPERRRNLESPPPASNPHIIPMRPVSLTYTGTVGVSIQDVFDLISDPSRMAEWLPNCVSVVPGPTGRGKGDRHRLHFERQGRKADAVIEVIEYEPPTTYAWVEIIYRRGSKTFFKLDFQGGTTKITMKCVWVPASWRAWLLGQFYRRRSAHKMFDGLLQNLRKALTR